MYTGKEDSIESMRIAMGLIIFFSLLGASAFWYNHVREFKEEERKNKFAYEFRMNYLGKEVSVGENKFFVTDIFPLTEKVRIMNKEGVSSLVDANCLKIETISVENITNKPYINSRQQTSFYVFLAWAIGIILVCVVFYNIMEMWSRDTTFRKNLKTLEQK